MGSIETIKAGDVTTEVYAAGDASPGSPGVVIFHPWWGLNADVRAYADRLSGRGFAVVAPDCFLGQIASTIDEAERLSSAADEATVNAIALATIDRFIDRLGPMSRVAALGFSFGAHWAMWCPAERDRLVASVVYYGTTDGPYLAQTSAPVLGHFAADDPYEGADWVAEFAEMIRSAGRDVAIHHYPGTGHWFAEPSRDAYVPAAAELAFERTVAFLDQHLVRR